MRQVWPPNGSRAELDRAALAEAYAYPAHLDRPFVRVNFVASADGAVSAGGVSTGLKAPGDRQVFGVLRELADVVLAGMGTVRTERYRGARSSPESRQRRRDRGQAEVPPVAVVTTTADLTPEAPLFTDTAVPPLLVTTTAAAARARAAFGDHAEVLPAGDELTPDSVLATLTGRGLNRVLCEGGPALFGSFATAGRVDELCLSVAPQLAGAGADRIITGPALEGGPEPMRLAAVLAHHDGVLLRYRTARGDRAARGSTPGPPA